MVANLNQIKFDHTTIDIIKSDKLEFIKIVKLIEKLVKNKHCNFLETFGDDLLVELFKDKRIYKTSLRIEKI